MFILVVDDSPVVLKLLGDVLADGHDLVLAASVEEGLRALGEKSFDLLFVDGLEGGWKVLAKEAREKQGIPFVVYSATLDPKGTDVMSREILELGGVSLSKPSGISLIREAVLKARVPAQ